MKRRDLLNQFQKKGWWIVREGHDHTILTNGIEKETVPRHKEIDEKLAKAIIKRRGL